MLRWPCEPESLRASALHEKTVLDAMREAVSHGAVLLACTDALQAQGVDPKRVMH